MSAEQEQKDLETNKLIAEFMGHNRYELKAYWSNISTMDAFIEKPSYHNSWDWLMPVIDKIGSLGYGFSITTSSASVIQEHGFIYTTNIYTVCGPTKIQSVYKTCIEFIKWYNEKK